jgi:hypothetical protein
MKSLVQEICPKMDVNILVGVILMINLLFVNMIVPLNVHRTNGVVLWDRMIEDANYQTHAVKTVNALMIGMRKNRIAMDK